MCSNKPFKQKLIGTFEAFDKLCITNDIKYFAAYGTLIGAVRHQGLIPWDDDIDVWMLPDDYYKFLSMKGKIEGHYDIVDKRDKDYWLLSLAKFIDTSTTLWETEHFPFVTGVYIDIFKLDYCDVNQAKSLRNEYDEVSYNLTYAMRHHTFNQYWKAFKGGHARLLLSYIKDTFYYRPRYELFNLAYNNCLNKIENSKGESLVSFDGLYGEKEVFMKDWFYETKRLPFESIEINVPSNYDAILRQLYGDYMQLPPVEKRVSHHSHYFLDLNRRWTIDEIKQYKKHYE